MPTAQLNLALGNVECRSDVEKNDGKRAFPPLWLTG